MEPQTRSAAVALLVVGLLVARHLVATTLVRRLRPLLAHARRTVPPRREHASSSANDEGGMSLDLAAFVTRTAADAVVHTCPAGNVQSWNRGAAEIFGVAATAALGQNLTELIIPEHARHIQPLDVTPPSRPVYDRKRLRRAPAMRQDGSFFTAEFTVMDLAQEAGAPSNGMVVVLRDASEMGETVRRLRVRVAELEANFERLVQAARPRSGPGGED